MRPKILIVEDEAMLARDLSRSLKDAGYDITGRVSSGEEAIRMVEESKPDVVLMDIGLKGEMDGIDAAKSIRNRHDIPVIYLTAFAAENLLERAKRTEPYAFLSKPVSLNELKITIETTLHKHEADRRVRVSENELRLVTDSLESLLAHVNSEQRYLWANRAYRELFAADSSTIEGRHVREVIGDEAYSRILPCIERALSGEKVSFDTFATAASGELKHFSATYVPDAKPDGTVNGFIVQAVDITDRKKAEEAVAQSERKYRQMFQWNEAVKLLIDPESGDIVDANSAASAFYGYTVDELKQLSIMDINMLPRDQVFKEMAKARSEGKKHFLFPHRLASGEVRHVEVYSGPVDTPERTLLYSIIHDITARKKAEEELRTSEALFRTTFESASIGVCLVGTDGRFLRVNRTMCELLGYTEKELCLMGFNDVTHEDDKDIGGTFVSRAVSGESDTTSFEKRYIHKSGKVVWAQVSSTVLRRPMGEPRYFITHVQDITERKQAEQERLSNLRFLKSMDRVNRVIQGASDLEQMMGDVLDTVLSIFDCDRAFLLYPCDPQAATWTAPMERVKPEWPGVHTLKLEMPMDPEVAEMLRILVASDGPVKFGPSSEHSLPEKVSEIFGIKSIMSTALHPKMDKPWQFGIHQCSHPRVWTSEDERLFKEIGRRLGDAVTTLLACRNSREGEERFRLLYENAPLAYQSLDENGKLLEVNQAWLDSLGYSYDEVIGKWCGDFLTEACRHRFRVYFPQFKAVGEIHGLEFEMARKDGSTILIAANGRVAHDARGQFKQTHCILHDITERKRSESILKARLALSEYAYTHTLDELLQKTLDIAESLTGSQISFFHFLEADQETFSLQTWSTNALEKMCTAEEKGSHYPAEQAGVWINCIHRRGPVIHNDCVALPHRKGMFQVTRELVVPVFQGNAIAAILGVGNKTSDYVEADVEVLSKLAEMAWDIVVRKMAEDALRRREEFLTSVMESLTHPFYVVNSEDYTVQMSNRAARSFGICEGIACYVASHGLTVPCGGVHHSCPMEIAKSTGQPAMVEHVHPDAEGRHRNIEVYAYPIPDEEGRVKQVIEYCLDVTDRTEARQSLLESERTLKTILSLSPSGIAYYRDGKLTWANRAMMELFGYRENEQEDLLGISPRSFYESDKEYHRVHEMLLPHLNEGRSAEVEARFRKKDGSVFVGSMAVSAPISDHVERETTVVISDITTRKAAEEERARLVTVIEQSAESIVVTDVKGRIQYVNPTFEKLTGYTAHEAVGQNPRILKSGKHDAEFYRKMWETLTRGDTWRGHLVNKRKDGSLFEEEATISPVRDESGNIVSYMGLKRDVTAQVLLEKQLHQAQKMESIGTLAGGIAHDFNNLLQIILGYADMLMMRKGEPLLDLPGLDTIRKAAKDGGELVKGLLTFSRQVESKMRPTDLNLQLKRIRTMLRRTIPRMVEIELLLADDVAPVNADAVQVEQVVLNLCVNAHHAMRKGGKLTIETEKVTLDEDYCKTHVDVVPGEYGLLKISDTGHGMVRQTVERIFEPFYTTKKAGEGTGFGPRHRIRHREESSRAHCMRQRTGKGYNV